MDLFYAGLSTWWTAQSADNFYIGIGGRLRNNIGRQNEQTPYAVLTQIDGLPEFFQDGNYDEVAYLDFQLDIYSLTHLEVLTLSIYAMALFDNATFAVTGWSILNFERTRMVLMPIETPEDVDHAYHRYLLEYKVTLQKARA